MGKRKREYLQTDGSTIIPRRTMSRYKSIAKASDKIEDHAATSSSCAEDAASEIQSVGADIDESLPNVCQPNTLDTTEMLLQHKSAAPLLSLDEWESNLLYKNSNVTVAQYQCMILEYALTHNLSKKATNDMLKLISRVLPSPNNAVASVHKLDGVLSKFYHHKTIQKYSYCTSCHHLLTVSEEICPNLCNAVLEKFLMCDIESQVAGILSDKKSWNAIQRRFSALSSDSLTDIYDGILYKKYTQPGGFLSSEYPANISFCLNTDGVKVFNSSTSEIWPIWLAVNELPPAMRFSKKYMILGGLWFSKDKPSMTKFLKPLVSELNSLYHTGIEVQTPVGEMKSKSMLLLFTGDLPARAKVANAVQYNGYYGCGTCNTKGMYTGSSMSWPYDPAAELRTHKSIIELATEAFQTGKDSVYGIKGVPILALHPPFDTVWGMTIDILHCCGVGVIKALLTSWFSVSKRKENFSIHNKLNVCDAKLMSIKVPCHIKRRPKCLSVFSKWKAIEFLSWLLYYSLPILNGELRDEYFEHYCLLVGSLHILLSEQITNEMLNLAEKCLDQFCLQHEALYGRGAMTMNVHLLTHLVNYTRAWGPVWVFSCFPFETMNHVLKQHFHGTREVAMQIAKNFLYLQVIPKLKLKFETYFPECSRNDTCVIGKEISITISQENKALLLQSVAVYTGIEGITFSCKYFERGLVKGALYHSALYKRPTTRNSYTVAYKNGSTTQYGQIKFFVSVSFPLQENQLTICAVEQFAISENFLISHNIDAALMSYLQERFITVNTPDHTSIPLQFIKAENIISHSIRISISKNQSVLVKMPNTLGFLS